MPPRIAIVGTGPTGLYTHFNLVASPEPLDLTLFEAQDEAGWGMPYAPDLNGRAMLANIASIEIPPLAETLVAWLARQDDARLLALGVPRERISNREFFPRVVLGEFFRDQLAIMLESAVARGHAVTVLAAHPVSDLELRASDVWLTAEGPDGPVRMGFDHVVAATGHTVPDWTETRPGVFSSPYPTAALRTIRNVHVGILGTSLSAVDALVAVAGSHGAFLRDAAGILQFFPRGDADAFRVTLMSRKGILPEADFFFPIPYDDNVACTPEAVDALIDQGRPDLLDTVFELFREELLLADPDFAAAIGLAALDADSFAAAYFAPREARDPFAHAAANLLEARANYEAEVVVPWRYAILRCHEVVERAVPHLSADDLQRFHRGMKGVFVDDYATIPHESIERLLAMARAERLAVLRLGADYELNTEGEAPGATVTVDGVAHHFGAFIDATGQRALRAADLPFPSLVAQGAVRPARARARALSSDEGEVETGGVELDAAFRPVNALGLHDGLHLLALPFLLHLLPFHQGITSSEELGRTVAAAILGGAGARLAA